MSVRHRTDGRADAAYCRIDRVGAIPVMLRDNDGFGFVSGAERLEADANLFWLLFAYNVSANRKIGADQVKLLHTAARPLSFASLVALTAPADIKAEVKRLRDVMLTAIGSPAADLKTRVDEALKGARESRFDTKSGPWSAVFVSAVVRGATIVHGVEADPTKPLFVSVKHIEYTKEALRRTPANGRPGVAGTYH